jgi:isopentenyl phosphate kinase
MKVNSTFSNLQFLKLGGSLITDKTRPHTLRPDVLKRLAEEIANVHSQGKDLELVIGNGAGSFAHVPAKKYGTRQGVHTPEEWHGFAEVWREAAALNSVVTGALQDAGLPAIAIHPSSALISNDGRVAAWDLAPLQAALRAGLVPVVHGDVIFDITRGGTILSTEDLFEHLARQLHPQRILLAGLEEGVWADYPACTQLITEITPKNLGKIAPSLGGSNATDVTGGMHSKVQQSLALAREIPGLEIFIFSGEQPGAVQRALEGLRVGTRVYAPEE